VIVPACNEEESIAATVRSLWAQQGIRLQIIAVDDRSTDSTGEILNSLMLEAADGISLGGCHTFRVLHISELPPKWLGKPHALATAAELAEADWLLFTDGDVLFAPDALARTLGYAEAQRADHVVLMPTWITKTPGEAAMHGAMHALSTWTLKLWQIADPSTRDFLGVGAFNLLRRSTYMSIGGFRALRMEVLEDLRLGWSIKRGGFRQRAVLGPGLAAVRWSEGAWGVVRNLEKNLFALYRYHLGAAFAVCCGLLIQIVWPIAAIFSVGSPGFSIGSGPAFWACMGAIVWYLAIVGIYVAGQKVTRVSPGYVVVYPLAVSLFLFAHLRSTVLAIGRGGILWRGTLYSLSELRASAGRFW
jgi:glycosyltransferase involved in cell wall biosynthesis